ncbi:hypothetical protein [Treponema sp. C6A8]|uniref:hypothetical protein n=1 Tax=Treponema sp. C6A8 TaxID=1410609 RepID=UPI000483221C|nr:hypothetical protein [Treponema sp. C6A8]
MRKSRLLIAALGVMLFASCASNSKKEGSSKSSQKEENHKYLAALDEGRYDDALKILSKQKKQKKNLIRDNYDLAMLYHLTGDYAASRDLMNQTERLMDASVTKSISQGFAAAVFNENSVEYEANPYEYIYLNIFNFFNYYNAGEEDEAGVEIRRMNDKQKTYLAKYGEFLLTDDNYNADSEVQNAYTSLNINPAEINGSAPAKPTSADIFKDSPAARYMSLLLYMREGDFGNAELDAKMLHSMNESFDTKSELNISRGKGRLDVISFTDLIGRREEERIVIGPIPTFPFVINKIIVTIPDFDIEFVYPKFVHTDNSRITAVKMIVNGQEKTLSLLEDFNYAVQKDVKSKAKKAYGRSVRRSLAKKLSAVISAATAVVSAQVAAEQADNPVAIAITKAAAIAAIYALPPAIEAVDKTETADIRQVYALPGKAYASGLELEPGLYDVTVQYLSGSRVIAEKNYSKIRVRENKPTILESLL